MESIVIANLLMAATILGFHHLERTNDFKKAGTLSKELVEECRGALRAIVPHILHRTRVSSYVELLPRSQWYRRRRIRVTTKFELSSTEDLDRIQSMMVFCIQESVESHPKISVRAYFSLLRGEEVSNEDNKPY